uniref:Uncharacterized protein n=1 Tax=Oryza sativa subsp. japonica TaxID=39947 RepID=Q851H3_ORYSJ|nr:hypothetical protein [Oryza sativa Japonica Group]
MSDAVPGATVGDMGPAKTQRQPGGLRVPRHALRALALPRPEALA